MSSAAKAIRINAEGDAYLEDSAVAQENAIELDTVKAGTRKRKFNSERKPSSKPKNAQKTMKDSEVPLEQIDPKHLRMDGDSKQKGRPGKRMKKSANDVSQPGRPVEKVGESAESPSFFNTGNNDANADIEEESSSRSWSSPR